MISLPVPGKDPASSASSVLPVGGSVQKGTIDSETIGGIWICVYFPRIALTVFTPPEGAPFVVIEEVRGQHIVHTACEIALSLGIMPGMPLHAAHVLCNNLSVRIRDIAGEEKVLRSLAERTTRFTPAISLSPPDSLLLEVSKSLRLFGGFDSLHDLVTREFVENPVISSAPSPAAASLLARNGLEIIVREKHELKSVLGELRIEDVGLSPGLVPQLLKCGLRTLRDLWRLSRPDLARRFGTELVAFLDKACGAAPDPGKRMVTRTRFFQHLELPVETRNSGLLIIAAEKLFEKARVFLQSRGSATEKMIFKLWYRKPAGSSRRYSSLVIRSQQADRHPQRFLPQFREKIEHMEIGQPVTGLSLRIDQVLPYYRESEDLFARSQPGRSNDHLDWQQLIDVLDARLGSKMIYCVAPEQDHRPEKAWRHTGPGQKQWNKGWKKEIPVPTRPLWLLDEPRKIPLYQCTLHPDGENERIESGWWDGEDFRRDYCIAAIPSGSRCWVFRDVNGANDFYMHGLYG
jgi:protein ImuB